MSQDKTLPDVRPGQVWADNDIRVSGRTLRVERIEDDPKRGEKVAVCTILTNDDETQTRVDRGEKRARDMRGKETRIAVRRMQPNSTGYRLMPQPPQES